MLEYVLIYQVFKAILKASERPYCYRVATFPLDPCPSRAQTTWYTFPVPQTLPGASQAPGTPV